jgi:signal transduction histidine kinase
MSIPQGNTGSSPQIKSFTRLDPLYRTPSLLVVVIAIAVIVSNAVAMFVLSHFDSLSHLQHHIVESLLLVALLFPALVLLVRRPAELHLARSRRAEEELAAERNKFRGMLDAMPSGASIINKFYQVEYVNMVLMRIFGAVDGRRCHEYFHGLPDVCPDCKLAEILGGESVHWESRCPGTGRIYEKFETPLPDSDGTIEKLTIVRDITARKEVENELRTSRQRLRSLSVHQQQVREEERTSISREIHDELGQVLATVQLGVSSLAEEYPDHWHLTKKVTGMEQMLCGAISTIRRISTQLRPAILDELGLAEAVEWQVTEFRTRTGIACSPDILLQETNFDREVATAVFRICQEALTNVMRHSGATRVSVSLEERNHRIVLIVTDNGCGIPPEPLRNSQSLGITGMRERAYAVGGRVRICRSLQQQGTIVLAHIPLALREKSYD